MSADRKSSRSNEEDWADDFISHRKISNYAHVARCEEGQPEQAGGQPEQVPLSSNRTGSEDDGCSDESPTHFGSDSEPECSPEVDMEVINCRTFQDDPSDWQGSGCPEPEVELPTERPQQAQMQAKLKQLITEAANGSRNGTDHLQKSLEDWMVRWERVQQEHVIAADQQIRNLQHEVEQLRALKASVHAKEQQ